MNWSNRHAVLLIIVFSLVCAIRITSPSDAATGDQPLQFAYIHDVVANGNWVVQHLADGTPAAKPPLYNWLAAAFALPGGESEFVTKLPSLLAALAALLLTWDLGRRLASPRLGLLAGLLLATSPMFAKHAWFARTDMLLTALVTAQFWAAVRVRPLLFWTAAALAMLTKGPVGILIPALSLSIYWLSENTLRQRWRELRWMPGLPLALLPFAAWFAAALWRGGQPVFDQLVMSETIDRFRAHSSKSKENRHLLYYIPHFLARMAPASLLAVLGLTRVRWRRPVEPVVALAGWWLIATLTLLSLIPSKRADRLFPLLPAVCLLAAWVVETFAVRGTATMLRVIAALFLAAAVAAPLVLKADPLVIGCALVVAAAAMALFAGAAKKNRALIAGALVTGMLALIAVYQYRVPPTGDTRRIGAVRSESYGVACATISFHPGNGVFVVSSVDVMK